jgi:hypothetical protein
MPSCFLSWDLFFAVGLKLGHYSRGKKENKEMSRSAREAAAKVEMDKVRLCYRKMRRNVEIFSFYLSFL